MDEAADSVAGEVSESQGDTAWVLESSVDCFGGAVGGAGMIEVDQGVSAFLSVRVLAGAVISSRPAGTASRRELTSRVSSGTFQARTFGAVGLDRNVTLVGEQSLEALNLGLSEQISTGRQCAPGPVERLTLTPPISLWIRRRHSSTLSPARDTTRVGVHHRLRLGKPLASGVPEPL